METSFLVWWYILTIFRSSLSIKRSLGQGQGHLMENAIFATWTSVLTWFDLSEVKVINEVKVILRSLGQGHLMENANLATWTSA